MWPWCRLFGATSRLALVLFSEVCLSLRTFNPLPSSGVDRVTCKSSRLSAVVLSAGSSEHFLPRLTAEITECIKNVRQEIKPVCLSAWLSICLCAVSQTVCSVCCFSSSVFCFSPLSWSAVITDPNTHTYAHTHTHTHTHTQVWLAELQWKLFSDRQPLKLN